MVSWKLTLWIAFALISVLLLPCIVLFFLLNSYPHRSSLVISKRYYNLIFLVNILSLLGLFIERPAAAFSYFVYGRNGTIITRIAGALYPFISHGILW